MQMIRIYTDTLTQILDSIDQCVLILTDDLHVRSANCAACKNLHLPENCLGAQIQLRATGDSIHGIMEYRMELLGRSYSIMGSCIRCMSYSDAIQVLLFREKGRCKMMFMSLRAAHLNNPSTKSSASPQRPCA